MAGKAMFNEDISMPLFVQGYLSVKEGEKGAVISHLACHLKELMPDSELYGWDKVKAYHTV